MSAEAPIQVPKKLPEFFDGQEIQKFPRNSCLFVQGENTAHRTLYGVADGRVLLSVASADGEENSIVHIVRAGEFFGQEDWQRAQRSMTAETDGATKIVQITLTHEQVYGTTQNSREIREALWKSSGDRIRSLTDRWFVTVTGDPAQKVAYGLDRLATADNRVTDSQGFIAKITGGGITRQTVNSQALPDLLREQLITMDGSQGNIRPITIVDREKLKNFYKPTNLPPTT